MAYERKTKDVITIQRFSKCWGWQDVNSYSQPDYDNPRASARADLREYRASGDDAPYRMITSRERIQQVPEWKANRPDYNHIIRHTAKILGGDR